MSRLIRNTETKDLKTREELQRVIDFRENNTEIVTVYARECKFNGIPLVRPNIYDVSGQVNIFDCTEIDGLRNKYKIAADISDEAISDCMKENGLLITLPRDNQMVSIPVCNVAMGSVGDRINLRGRGMYAVEETKIFEPYSPTEKAMIANMGLNHNKGLMQAVMQDETIVTIRSSEYTHLPVKGIVEAYEEAMAGEFEEVKFLNGYIDRTIMICDYELVDKEKSDFLAEKLRQLGFDCEEVRTMHRIVTSDVGESAVRIYAVHDLGSGRKIITGDQAGLIHNKGASVEKFKERTCKNAIALLSDAEKTLEKLAKIQIKHPGGCFRNIAAKLRLPKEASLLVAEEFAACYYTGCTALDVYCSLFQIVAEKERQMQTTFDKVQILNFNERISKSIFMDFEISDIEFEWKD